MKSGTRILAVWAVTLSLLAGLWLPMTARFEAVDPDGICGPLLASAAQSVQHFDAGQTRPSAGHCLFCHLRHDMAGAFVSAMAQVVLPVDDVRAVPGGSSHDVTVVVVGQAPPRGPPAIS
jgi:hypothetical protein